MVRFFTYSQYNGKSEPVGSTFIRVDQLIKYWPEAALYKYGENPDVLIFQKVFVQPDYQFIKNWKGLKILDICDPMWFEGVDIVETCHAVDAVTVPTENLATFIRQFHKKVVVIPDRFDLEVIPPPPQPKGKAKSILWFGYSHNAECLKPALPLIDELKLNLTIISNDDPLLHRWSTRNFQEFYTYKRYDEATIYEEIQKADFAVLPDGVRPEDYFKSNNKTVKCQLAGIPVAKTPEEVSEFMEAENRQKWLDENYDIIRNEYDVKNSIKEFKDLISEIHSRDN